MAESKECYMDLTHWQELLNGHYTEIYSSLEELKDDLACWDQCGVVKLKVEVVEVVVPKDPNSRD